MWSCQILLSAAIMANHRIMQIIFVLIYMIIDIEKKYPLTSWITSSSSLEHLLSMFSIELFEFFLIDLNNFYIFSYVQCSDLFICMASILPSLFSTLTNFELHHFKLKFTLNITCVWESCYYWFSVIELRYINRPFSYWTMWMLSG